MSTKESTKNAVINGKEINLNDWLTTLKPVQNGNYTAEIEVMDYLELGCLIDSLTKVCRSAIEDTENIAKPEEISKVLEIVQNLIPFAELEFLDRIKVF